MPDEEAQDTEVGVVESEDVIVVDVGDEDDTEEVEAEAQGDGDPGDPVAAVYDGPELKKSDMFAFSRKFLDAASHRAAKKARGR